MDYRKGGREQIWIAGGIVVTPFLSWIRGMSPELNQRIDFFYTVRTRDETLFLSEILEAANRHKHFVVHTHFSADHGRLSVEDIVNRTGGRLADKHIYMSGPSPMLVTFQRAFRRLGVPAGSIYYEEFGFR